MNRETHDSAAQDVATKSSHSLAAFIVVGGIGFITDAAFLQLFAVVLQWNIFAARVLAFVPATLVTWLLNRTWSFRVASAAPVHKGREYAKYLTVQCVGVTVNFAIFSALVMMFPALKLYPVLPLAAGSAVGLIVNYTGSRLWVFAASRASQTGA